MNGRHHGYTTRRAGICCALVLAAAVAGCGQPAAAPPWPDVPAAIASSPAGGKPRFLPEDQRKVVDLLTLGVGGSYLQTQATEIPTFVPGAELGRIHVKQLTQPTKPYKTIVEIRNKAGTLVHSEGGQGSYDIDWTGLGADQKPLPGGEYEVRLKKNDTFRTADEWPDGTLKVAWITITELSLEIIRHDGLTDLRSE